MAGAVEKASDTSHADYTKREDLDTRTSDQRECLTTASNANDYVIRVWFHLPFNNYYYACRNFCTIKIEPVDRYINLFVEIFTV